jgi:hypothetical protein
MRGVGYADPQNQLLAVTQHAFLPPVKDLPFDPYDFFGYLASGLLVLFGLEFVSGVPTISGRDLKTLDLVVALLAAYVAGQLIATPARAVLEVVLVGKALGPPSVTLMAARQKSIWRFMFPGYFQPLPDSVRAKIIDKARSEGLSAPEGEALFLHIRFRDYMRADSTLSSRLNSFLNTYGFSRNLAFSSFLFGLATTISAPPDLSDAKLRYGLMGIAAGLLLTYRYLKFFRQYTYELFNTYAGRA